VVERVRTGGDARREQLLVAGVELLKKRPHYEVSIEEIAAAAGVSKGLLYHYFPTKNDFIVAALQRGRQELVGLLAPRPDLPPVRQLDASLDAFLDYVEEYAAAFSAIFRGGLLDPEVSAVLESGRGEFLQTLIAAITEWRDGPFSVEHTAALEAAVQGWLFFCEGAVLRWLEHGGLERWALRIMLRNALGGAVMAATTATDAEARSRKRAASGERSA
jgi:AcrR family transcriptional regulator